MNLAELQRLEERATNLRNTGQIDEAIKAYDVLAAAYTRAGDTTRAAGMVHMMGVSYKVANKTSRSLGKLEEAKRMYEQAGDAAGAGRALRDIGITHAYAGDYEAAELLLLKSISHLKEAKAPDELALGEVKLGENYLRKGDTARASEWIEKGWAGLKNSGHWFYVMTALMHRAELAFAVMEYEKAEELARQALSILKDRQEAKNQTRRQAQLCGLVALSRLARQQKPGPYLKQAWQGLDKLDGPSRSYLLKRTPLRDLPKPDKGGANG